jgi:Holliday junction resolvase|tara:strand:+ start:68 stop:511 length:444 start_codon:yes stop_codon:yes gene_type:complete
MVDPRAKGAEGERQVRDLLRKHTELEFQRVPMSGALDFMKGDIFLPNMHNNYCIEVKFYKDSHFSDKVLTAKKSNVFIQWWNQTIEQAKKAGAKPALFFKYNRSKIFVAQKDKPENGLDYMYVSFLGCYVSLAQDWLILEKPSFTNG